MRRQTQTEPDRHKYTDRQAGGGGGEIRIPEIQRSRNPEIQRSRNPEIQKSSRRRNQPQGPPQGTYRLYIYIYIYLHNHIHIKLIESISTKATQNTPPPCQKHGPFWTRHGVGGFEWLDWDVHWGFPALAFDPCCHLARAPCRGGLAFPV